MKDEKEHSVVGGWWLVVGNWELGVRDYQPPITDHQPRVSALRFSSFILHPSSFRRRLVFWIVDFALLAVFLIQVVLFWGLGKEDAYISFRYARNLVRGDGLVYNPGEYVEGISNLLWTLCLAGLHATGLPMEAAFRIISIVCTLAAFLFFWWTARRLFGSQTWLARLPLLSIACMSSMPASYGNGLEGSFVGLTVALLVAGAALPHVGLLTLGAAMMILNRPEGVGFAGIAGLWLLYQRLRGRQSVRAFVAFAAITALTLGLVTAFRLIYFDDFIPNTLRAKATGSWRQVSPIGLAYLRDYLSYIGWPMLLLLAVAPWSRRRRPLAVFLFLLLVASGFVVWANGGDWMVHYRLLTPYYPCFAFLAVMGVEAAGRRGRWMQLIAVALCCVCAGRMLHVRELAEDWKRFPGTWYGALHEPDTRNAQIADHLIVRDFTRPDDRFVVESGGAPGYFLDGVRVIEMNGLADRAIATLNNPYAYRRTATGTINWIEVFRKEPTYFLFNMMSTFLYTSEIFTIPEIQDKLKEFLFVQKLPLGSSTSLFWFNTLLVRGDRTTLASFVEDFGAFAPIGDFTNPQYRQHYMLPMQDPASGEYRNDLFMTPWDAAPWETDAGSRFQPAWRPWGRSPRLSYEIPLHAGHNVLSKTVPDGAPLVLLCGIDRNANPQATITVTRQTDGAASSVKAATDLRALDEASLRVWVLPITGEPSEAAGKIVLDIEAASEGSLRLAAHRWVNAPFPVFPTSFDVKGSP